MKLAKLFGAAILTVALTTGIAQAKNIVETAASTGQFNTLIAAAKAAGLADALSSTGPITVFAPTDEAFAKLPAGTVEDLLKPENKPKLVAILTYHVVGRELTSDMLPGKSIHVKPLNTAHRLTVKKSGSGVMIDNAKVVSADIQADNGTIHVIDKVLIPGS